MGRSGRVYYKNMLTGLIEETGSGFRFVYDKDYLLSPDFPAISLTLPKRAESYESPVLFPFFYGLLAEGILKQTQCRKLKLDENDHFGRLLKTAHADVIGAITVIEVT